MGTVLEVEVFAVGPIVLPDVVQKSVQEERTHGVVVIYSHLVQVRRVRSEKGLGVLLLKLLLFVLPLLLLRVLLPVLNVLLAGLGGAGGSRRITVAPG